jgi:hypothetical protein
MVMTPVDQAVIGGLSGTVEVCLMQPTVAIKNAVQEGRPLPWNPAHMYRGLGVRLRSTESVHCATACESLAGGTSEAVASGTDDPS